MNLRLLRLAIDTAKATEPVGRAKVGAVLAHRSHLISVGWNKAKTHPLAKRFGRNPNATFIHAEFDALHNAEMTEGCELYVARTWKSGQLALAKPCPGCMKAIDFYGCSVVYWTIGPNEDIGCLRLE